MIVCKIELSSGQFDSKGKVTDNFEHDCLT